MQYGDFAVWQHEVLGSEEDPDSALTRQLDYWKDRLAGLGEPIALPTSFPRPAKPSMVGSVHRFAVSPQTHRALTDLAREHGTTMFMLMHAALAVLAARLAGTEDIAIGTPVAGRGEAALDVLPREEPGHREALSIEGLGREVEGEVHRSSVGGEHSPRRGGASPGFFLGGPELLGSMNQGR